MSEKKLTTDEMIQKCLDDNLEDEVHEAIDEAKYDYVDADDIEEHGDIYEAYIEVGRGEAETSVLNDIMAHLGDLDLDTHSEIWDALCQEWGISTD